MSNSDISKILGTLKLDKPYIDKGAERFFAKDNTSGGAFVLFEFINDEEQYSKILQSVIPTTDKLKELCNEILNLPDTAAYYGVIVDRFYASVDKLVSDLLSGKFKSLVTGLDENTAMMVGINILKNDSHPVGLITIFLDTEKEENENNPEGSSDVLTLEEQSFIFCGEIQNIPNDPEDGSDDADDLDID